MTDRVGLGWRPELAAGILAHADRIDAVEVLLDSVLHAPQPMRRALRTLARSMPLMLHGVALGAASASAIDARRLDPIARLVADIEPECWSEHLAFVRGGGTEIGHLAAPPRCDATVAGTAMNLEAARRVVGALPHVENVATLLEPPGSDRDEVTWIDDVLRASGAPLLLDLHNLHANAVNSETDARAELRRLPLHRVNVVHVAGGRMVRDAASGQTRLLDDHLHDVPDAVHELLEDLAALAPQPLTVILERDGRHPPMSELLRELDLARAALSRGRSRAAASRTACTTWTATA